MSSIVPNGRVLKWQHTAKICIYMGKDVYTAVYLSTYVLAQCQSFNQCLLLWS